MMKPMMSRAHKFGFAVALLVLPLASHAAPPKAANAATQSTFTLPKNAQEGRDPFFPKATSLYQAPEGTKVVVAVDSGINLLKLNGILGSSLAQVNNVTLSVGETEEVKMGSGSVAVKLIEIRAADGSVVIEANGQRRVLRFAAK